MKIRATNKVLNIARIEAMKDSDPLMDKMPGEWYASIVSRGMPGKLAIHFLHYPTLASLIIPEKSLNKAVKEIPDHLAALLARNGFSKLLPEFQIDTVPQIFSTNNKSMLGYLKEMAYTLEYHFRNGTSINMIENIELDNLFHGILAGKGYVKPRAIMHEMLKKYEI